ncbi:MAG: molybdopterin converting factor subunit 1 [Oceanicoccus sp.]|jgi:molybdopterin converting factor subunit 1
MIKVLFFASIREQLKASDLIIPFCEKTKTVAGLIDEVVKAHDSGSREILLADNVVVAVNQQIVGKDVNLFDGDEVAFFPPVTGG